jgi:exosortase A
LVWLLGDMVAVNAVTQFSLVTMLVLMVPLVAGIQWAKKLAFPLFFLYFAVPFGEFALPQFMEWTADFTVAALRLTGIPVYREGLQFVIPSGRWSVVEACSGIRYLIASVTVGTLYAYLTYRSLKKRLLFVGVSILVPVVANWLRAYMIVMLGHLSGNTLAVGVDHLIYGWVFFGVVIFVMFWIGARWADPPLRETNPTWQSQGNALTSSVANALPGSSVFRWLPVLGAALVLTSPFLVKELLGAQIIKQPVKLSPPSVLGTWQRSESPWVDWSPSWRNPSDQLVATYEKSGQRIGVFVGYYRNQNYGRKLVSSTNVLLRSDDPNWAVVRTGSAAVSTARGSIAAPTVIIREGAVGQSDSAKRLRALRLYWVNGQWVASDVRAKLAGAMQQLMLRGDDAAVVVIYGLETSSDLADFLGVGIPALEQWLGAIQQKPTIP